MGITMMYVMLLLLLDVTYAQPDNKESCRNVVYNVHTLQQNACCQNGTSGGSGVQDLKDQFASLQSKVQALENQLKQIGVKPTPVPDADNQYYNYMDEIAQASCVAMMPSGGWAYAVRKACSGSKTCATICAQSSLKAQDSQVAKRTMTCFNSLHIYHGRPRLNLKYQSDLEKLGLKVYRYNACGGGCGPNYCCCKAV